MSNEEVMSRLVAELEAVSLPMLEAYAEELRLKHPQFDIQVWHDCKSYEAHHVYDLGIDCSHTGLGITRAKFAFDGSEPNCVSLCISICVLDGVPEVTDLCVAFGADGRPPCDDLDLCDEDVSLGPDVKRIVEPALPTLRNNLSACLEAWERAYI